MNNKKQENNSQSMGLGDDILKITKATGIKAAVDFLAEKLGFDCGCDARKEALNNLFPYKKIECLEQMEYLYLKEFNWNVYQLTPDDQKRLLAIYNRVFSQKRQPTTCGSCWNQILSELKKLYDEHNV